MKKPMKRKNGRGGGGAIQMPMWRMWNMYTQMYNMKPYYNMMKPYNMQGNNNMNYKGNMPSSKTKPMYKPMRWKQSSTKGKRKGNAYAMTKWKMSSPTYHRPHPNFSASSPSSGTAASSPDRWRDADYSNSAVGGFPTKSPVGGTDRLVVTRHPTSKPTDRPTKAPTRHPTYSPTASPTALPQPSATPSTHPSEWPSVHPSEWPSAYPTDLSEP